MAINQLINYGKQLKDNDCNINHNSLKETKFGIILTIDKNGAFLGFNSISIKTTICENILVKKGHARLLVDKAEEVIKYVDPLSENLEKSTLSTQKKYQLFQDKLSKFDLLEISPVKKFYKNKESGVDKALSEFEKQVDEKKRPENIVFLVLGDSNYIHEQQAIYDEIIKQYNSLQMDKMKGSTRKCSTCGSDKYPVEDTPYGMVQGVPNGQSTGCALISFNFDSVESYGLKGNLNAGMCTECASNLNRGLSYLLNNRITITETIKGVVKNFPKYTNRKNIGEDTCVIYWCRNNEQVNIIDSIDKPTPEFFTELIESISKSNPSTINLFNDDAFYILEISGNSARISVRSWVETTLRDVRINIKSWYDDIGIITKDFDTKEMVKKYPNIYSLSHCSFPKKKESGGDKILASRIESALWQSALRNTFIPLWIVEKILQRIRRDSGKIDFNQVVCLRLILNRNNKGGEKIMGELDTNNKNKAYICGRVLAVVERAQYLALEKETIGEQFYSSFSTTPAMTISGLLKMNKHYVQKLKASKKHYGTGVNIEKSLTNLLADVCELPSMFSLEEQGQFTLGYYFQRKEQFNKVSEKE